MKTATITYHKVPNYGALLQAYALQQIQNKLQVDNVIIDYSPIKMKQCKKFKVTNYKLLIIKAIFFILSLIFHKRLNKQYRIFQTFSEQILRLTKEYRDYESLQEDPPKADLYLAGSDQIWNVSNTLYPAFFLGFGDLNTRRAAYAVSMGECHVPDVFIIPMQTYLGRFEAISVREPCAKDSIESILHNKLDVHLHIDPVFLLTKEEWLEFSCVRKVKAPYILCFPMGGHPLMNKSLQKLKQLTGYETVVIATDLLTGVKGDRNIWDATPQEFVSLIAGARYVITTSLHGTVFSVIFNKQFYSLTNRNNSGRIDWILQHFGLNDRIVSSLNDIKLQEIDYNYCNHIIEEEQALSLIYLQSLLQ